MSRKMRAVTSVVSVAVLAFSFAANPIVIRNQPVDFTVNDAFAMGGGGDHGGGSGDHGGSGGHHGADNPGAGTGPGADAESGWQGMHQDMETYQNPVSQGDMDQSGAGPMMSGETIRSVQHKLNQLGFHAGPEDGMMGPQTLSAVTAYQAHMGITPDGVLTPDLANRIMTGSTTRNAN